MSDIMLPGGTDLKLYESQYPAAQFEAAIGKGPIIENNTWWVWDIETSAYKDTGVNAVVVKPRLEPRGPRRTDLGTPGQRWIDTAHGNIEYTCLDSNGVTAVWIYSGGIGHNMIDNPNFSINQKGQSTYSTPFTYGADRWIISADMQMEITPTGVSLIGSGDESYIFQRMEMLKAGTYTLSCLFKENTGEISIGHMTKMKATSDQSGLLCTTYVVPEDLTGNDTAQIVFASAQFDLIAVMLELGGTQHLAHQDMDGNWVLNSIPDYGEELAKCQYYSRDVGVGLLGTYSFESILLTFPFPSSMRIPPIATLLFNNNLPFYDQGGGQTILVNNARIDAQQMTQDGAVYIIIRGDFSSPPTDGTILRFNAVGNFLRLDAQL